MLWQNLFQPDYLDPFLHGVEVAGLAAEEIEKFYATGNVKDSERQFFDQALQNYRAVTESKPAMKRKFIEHIKEIETKYHPDKLGQFESLWPEFKDYVNN